MKILRLALIATALSMTVQTQASPITYDIGFNGGGSTASGKIVVDSGVATSGYLDVTAGPALGDYFLYTWTGGGISSVRVDGTDLIVDNVVNVGSNPFLDIYGLGFVSTTLVSGEPAEGIDLSLDSGTAYNLGGFGTDGYYNPNTDGTATLAAARVTGVPDTASTAGLLGASFGAMAFVSRRKFA